MVGTGVVGPPDVVIVPGPVKVSVRLVAIEPDAVPDNDGKEPVAPA
jgi:hypothetical protein